MTLVTIPPKAKSAPVPIGEHKMASTSLIVAAEDSIRAG